MNRHLLIVANGFRVLGCLLGLPSLLAFLYLTAMWIDLVRLTPAPDMNESRTNVARDGIWGLLAAGGAIVGKGLEIFAKLGTFFVGAMDILALGLTLIGAVLFFTGRGLYGHAVWARVAAGLVAFVLFCVSFLAFTSVRRGPNFFALLPVSLSLYMIWVLIRRFS